MILFFLCQIFYMQLEYHSLLINTSMGITLKIDETVLFKGIAKEV